MQFKQHIKNGVKQPKQTIHEKRKETNTTNKNVVKQNEYLPQLTNVRTQSVAFGVQLSALIMNLLNIRNFQL